ncbi:Late embryogenesis abundant (LEA) hydroxyproline-rich glycoprotein family [Euphorbia peplus]|nr:Late embryogenesis abundant (LEA) hydroxyproline-rich glycoprotein family [Euphorbia peplus]
MTDPSRPATGYPVNSGQHLNGYPPATHYPPPPPGYYPNNRRSPVLRRILGAIIGVTVIFFVIFFICWLVIRPHRPEFDVSGLSVSDFNVSTSSESLSGRWNARFQIYNPNKKLKLSYDDIVCWVMYGSEILSETRIPPFKQDTGNVTTVEASFSALDAYVDGAATRINGDRTRGAVGFNLRLIAGVGFRINGLRARRRMLRVWCDDVAVGFSANGGSGNLTGGPRECKVFA